MQMKAIWGIALGTFSLMGCATQVPPKDGTEATPEELGVSSPQEAEEAAPVSEHAVELAQQVAQKTADAWNGSKAAEEEVMMGVRIRVDDKPAGLRANGEGIAVLTGADGAKTTDVDADITLAQAQAIMKGETSLKKLIAGKSLKTENMDALVRFAEFLND